MKSNFNHYTYAIKQLISCLVVSLFLFSNTHSQSCTLVAIDGSMFYNEDGTPATGTSYGHSLGDEQTLIGDPVNGNFNNSVTTNWQYPWVANAKVYIELPQVYNLEKIWLYEDWGTGDFSIALGLPSENNPPFETISTSEDPGYVHEIDFPANTQAQYLTFTKISTSGKIREIALCASSGPPACNPTVSPQSLNFQETSGTDIVNVSGISNGWTASSSNQSWLTVSNTNSTINVTYTANPNANSRTANISITCTNGSQADPIVVTQAGTGGGACTLVPIDGTMFYNEDGTLATGTSHGNALGDEQNLIGDPVNGNFNNSVTTNWQYPWVANAKVYLELPEVYNLEKIWLYEDWGTGDFSIALGLPSENNPPFETISTSEAPGYVHEIDFPANTQAQFITFTKITTSGKIREIALCGSTGGPSCNPTVSPGSFNFQETAGTDAVAVSGISNGWTATSSDPSWLTVTNTNSTINLSYTSNPNTNSRSANITINCTNGTQSNPISVTQAGSGTCSAWPDANAGRDLLESQIVYNQNDPTTFTFQTDNPSPYTFGEMIGVGIKSTFMDAVYDVNNNTLRPGASDDYITQLSSHVRSFHFMEKDYEFGHEPRTGNGVPTKISGLSSLMERYESWKTIWANGGQTDISIIAALELSTAVNGQPSPNAFPLKWWTPDQWGNNNLSEIYTNAKTYGFAFAEASCPNGIDCTVDVLEGGNEPWQYSNPAVYQEILKGLIDGVKDYFITHNITDPDQWPMKVMPGAFQAFRAEGVIPPVNTSSLYDHVGTRLPCDYADYIHGISVHPYSFTKVPNSGQDWKLKIYDLIAHPEDVESQFQFVKNSVFWRNKNLPNKESANPDRYKAKVYVTEFGWDSKELGSVPRVGEIAQSLYLVRSILMMSRLSIYRTNIYEAWDDVYQPDQFNSSGLYATDANDVPNIPKRSYNAVKNFRDLLIDQRFLEALHDGDAVNGANLYAYTLSAAASAIPDFLVVWDGKKVDDAQTTTEINNLRTSLTDLSNKPSVDIDISSIISLGLTVDASAAEWLHDQAGALYGSSNITVNGNTLTLNASPVPVLIPLTTGGPGGGGLLVTLTPSINPIQEGQNFTLTLKVKNDDTQTINNINTDCLGLNYNHSAGSGSAFTLENSGSISPSHGSYNWWTAQWNIGNLVSGEEATLDFVFKTRVSSECVSGIPVSATATENGNNYSGSESIDCSSSFTSSQDELQELSMNKVYLFPNPAENEFQLQVNSRLERLATVRITDGMGTTIIAEEEMLSVGDNQFKLDISKLEPGVYYISMKGITDAVRFVKIKK